MPGTSAGYFSGRKAGPAIFNREDSRVFRQEYVQKARAYFARFGGRAVILACFVPIVRTFVPVIAGVAHMHYRFFALFNFIGSMLWGVGVTLLGYWLGHYEWVDKNIEVIFAVIVLLSVSSIGIELLKARNRKPRGSQ